MIHITNSTEYKMSQSIYEKSYKYLIEKDIKKLILIFITPKDVKFTFDPNLISINQYHLPLDLIKLSQI